MKASAAPVVPAARARWSPEETATRRDLAACYRLMHHFGMTDLTYTFITARIPGTDRILLNTFGLLFDEVTASSLATVDLDGALIDDPTNMGINPAAFVIHGAIHKARPELACVLHAHTAAGVAVSAQECGLLPLSQNAMKFYDRIGYHDYEGIALDLDEQERLVRAIGKHHALILWNHGTITTGETIAAAFHNMYFLERACQVQVRALAGGVKAKQCDPAAAEKTAHLLETHPELAERDWASLLRMLERTGITYDG